MSMSIAGMAAEIEGAITAPITSKAQFATALATAIVNYLKNNAVVDPTGSPPMTAPTGGGPVTGYGKVT